jgi:biotin carboxyl carrier protein
MSVTRLRAITDDGTFTVSVDANHVRLRPETDPPAQQQQQQQPLPRSSAASPDASDTTFQIAPIDTGVLSVASVDDTGTPRRAHVLVDGDTTWVFIDGETFTIDVEPAERARARRGAAGNEALAAPMPATVIKVLVEPGADVHRGDVLVLLEAMKMELPVRAPRDGRVKALHCRAGELVQPGTALVDLE